MNSPQEPVSPSPSTPSSGSPPPDDIFIEQINAAAAAASQQIPNLSQSKRRLPSGPPSQTRDIKTRRRDDGTKRNFAPGDVGGRESGRRDEFIDTDLMERLKQEFGDPFDESDLKVSLNQ